MAACLVILTGSWGNRMEVLPVMLDAAVGLQYQVRVQAILRLRNYLLTKPGLAPAIKAFAASRLKLLHTADPPAAIDADAHAVDPANDNPDIMLEMDLTPAHAGVQSRAPVVSCRQWAVAAYWTKPNLHLPGCLCERVLSSRACI